MILRIIVPLLLIILLPDLYLYRHYVRHSHGMCGKARLAWWLPSALMLVYTAVIVLSRDFAPSDMSLLNCYLFLVGILVVPKALFALCSVIGLFICRISRSRLNFGNLVGFMLALLALFIVVYGSTVGFRKLEVRHVDYYSADLPQAFDGYRILHFSDAHVGSYTGNDVRLLEKAVATINAINADVVAFTGDLQNMHPREIYPVAGILGRIKAKDGVYSVLGNHDYARYVDASDEEKQANECATIECERKMGWHLLLNNNRIIRRGTDSIVIAGMENDGRPPFPQRGDVARTLAGTGAGAFAVMLQHDPTAWRRKILPRSRAQLTLSGHTHAMQFSLFGWSPSSWVYDEWGGMFNEGGRALNVSVGLGGFIPFRFGATGEVVVITLRKKNRQQA